jgi:cytidylate kinase
MIISLKDKALNTSNKFVVALDGPSASGKGLIGKMLAERFSLIYFQSSILYRGLAWLSIQHKIDIENIRDIIQLSKDVDIQKSVENIDLSDEYIGGLASKIAPIPEVRSNLNQYQLDWIADNSRIIIEGRDIATVIAPTADLKIFITADLEVRAKRRYKQLRLAGKKCILEVLLYQLTARDERDADRDLAPLARSGDALIIDTSNLTPAKVIDIIEEFILKN